MQGFRSIRPERHLISMRATLIFQLQKDVLLDLLLLAKATTERLPLGYDQKRILVDTFIAIYDNHLQGMQWWCIPESNKASSFAALVPQRRHHGPYVDVVSY